MGLSKILPILCQNLDPRLIGGLPYKRVSTVLSIAKVWKKFVTDKQMYIEENECLDCLVMILSVCIMQAAN